MSYKKLTFKDFLETKNTCIPVIIVLIYDQNLDIDQDSTNMGSKYSKTTRIHIINMNIEQSFLIMLKLILQLIFEYLKGLGIFKSCLTQSIGTYQY